MYVQIIAVFTESVTEEVVQLNANVQKVGQEIYVMKKLIHVPESNVANMVPVTKTQANAHALKAGKAPRVQTKQVCVVVITVNALLVRLIVSVNPVILEIYAQMLCVSMALGTTKQNDAIVKKDGKVSSVTNASQSPRLTQRHAMHVCMVIVLMLSVNVTQDGKDMVVIN